MASPAPALVVLRSQLASRYPGPRGCVDGIMGDQAHQKRQSAHNQGNALDVMAACHPGLDLERLVQSLRQQMRANPLGGRLRLLIYRRRIWSGPDWAERRYTGANPHEGHAHVEVKPSHRGITRPWSLP